jgi:adenine-specific DNA-methyltransferase
MIKYIGSKRTLVPLITQAITRLPVDSVCDMFAGTTRVGQGLRSAGLFVHSNDLATYSEVLGIAYIEADESLDRVRIGELLEHLDQIKPEHGYFTETFCVQSRFFQPANGMKVDAIRDEIERLDLTRVEKAVLLVSLMEAADRVDSTCGLQMAYVKKWAARSFNPLELRMPAAIHGPPGKVTRVDANELAATLGDVDCSYIDPPYNQHSYFSNYHIWESLIRWDRPEHYGVACKRIDCRTTKSAYNRKREAWDAFAGLIREVTTPWMVVSFSNEGYHEQEAIESLLSESRHVRCIATDFKRYVGAQIGIHNPDGERVGEVSHLRNKELLFLAGPDPVALDLALRGLEGMGEQLLPV